MESIQDHLISKDPVFFIPMSHQKARMSSSELTASSELEEWRARSETLFITEENKGFQVVACVQALENGVTTVITNGLAQNAITEAVAGKKIGTMFCRTHSYEGPPAEELASKCKKNGKYGRGKRYCRSRRRTSIGSADECGKSFDG